MKIIELRIPNEVLEAAQELVRLYEEDKKEEFGQSKSIHVVIDFATSHEFVKKMSEHEIGPMGAFMILTRNEEVSEILEHIMLRMAPIIILSKMLDELKGGISVKSKQNAPSSDTKH